MYFVIVIKLLKIKNKKNKNKINYRSSCVQGKRQSNVLSC